MTFPSNPITIAGDIASIDFTRFDLGNYELFLKVKQLPESQIAYDWRDDHYTVTTPARFAARLGVDIPPAERTFSLLADHLFDYQAWAVKLALEAKRFALWLNTGLGKTPCMLEWANQVVMMTGGRVLILAPLAVIPQTITMARVFYEGGYLHPHAIQQLSTREELIEWCEHGGESLIAMCNYEKLIAGEITEFRHLAGLVLDESSMLKTGGGKIKWNLIHSAKGIEYKLSCTATPAPNDAMEYASQASFLETMRNEGEVLWTYFSREKSGEWVVKPHAREAFFRFMASWSLYLHDPAHFGFGDILSTLPDPVIHEERIPLTDEQSRLMRKIQVQYKGDMLGGNLGVVPRAKLAQLARGFLYQNKGKQIERVPSLKPDRIAEIVAHETSAGRQVLIWTTFDEEAPILEEALERRIPGKAWLSARVRSLSGKHTAAKRLDILNGFRAGDFKVLISKPSLIGYGLNLQFVRAMVFSGFDDSFERSYQAIRRAYRFGQTEPVQVYWPYVPELEGVVFENIRQKEARFLGDVAAQEAAYRRAFYGSGELAE